MKTIKRTKRYIIQESTDTTFVVLTDLKTNKRLLFKTISGALIKLKEYIEEDKKYELKSY